MKFRVWGKIDNKAFSATFNSVADWKAERKIVEQQYEVIVLGMASV